MEKLKIVKDKENKYHFKTKTDNRVDIEHKDRKLKFKLHKWGGEASAEVSLPMVKADTHTFTENRIEVEDNERIVSVYPIDIDDGGIKLKVVDKVKSPPYILKIPIVCKNTRWSKQRPLNEELNPNDYDSISATHAIRDGVTVVYRPEPVVNSFAVYHASKKNNQYMAGKMGQWYQTKVIDAEGNWAWCDTDVDRYIDPTMLTITAPTEFMENAVYPVTWDPDFGETGIGGSWKNIAIGSLNGGLQNFRAGSAWPMPAPGGTAKYIRAYVRSRTEVAGDTCDCKSFINQKDSGGANTHGQIAVGGPNTCPGNPHWEEFTLAGEALTAAVVYILNVRGDYTSVSYGIYYELAYDTGGTAVNSYYELTLAAFCSEPDPWVWAPEGTTSDYSIYANYSIGWEGKISGVVAPAAIAGVPKANIQSVKGVA